VSRKKDGWLLALLQGSANVGDNTIVVVAILRIAKQLIGYLFSLARRQKNSQ
jgi:hypothetical protein